MRVELPTVEALQGVIAKLKNDWSGCGRSTATMSEAALAIIPSPAELLYTYGRFDELAVHRRRGRNSKKNYR